MLREKFKKDFDEVIGMYNPAILRRFDYNCTEKIPEIVIYMLSKVGVSSWLDGIFRTCDPELIWPSLDDALDGKNLLQPSDCVPYLISAFGVVYAWNAVLGAIKFDFQRGCITCFEDPNVENRINNEGSFLAPFIAEKDTYDEYGLYDTAVKKFGTLSENQIFSFAPIFALGGQPKRSNLIVTDVRAHLALLAQSQEFDILHFDSERYPGGFERME